MFGLRRFSCAVILVFAVLISLSQSEDGGGFFTKFFQHASAAAGNAYNRPSRSSQSVSPSPSGNLKDTNHLASSKTISSRSLSANETAIASASVSKGRAHNNGWGWDDGGHGHGHGGGGGGGWGWPQTHYVPYPSHGHGGIGLNGIIGALSLLGLLGLLAYTLFARRTATVVLVNSSGRRRRAIEDYDDGLEGESLPEMLSRIGGYIETAWTGKPGGNKLNLFNLPQLD